MKLAQHIQSSLREWTTFWFAPSHPDRLRITRIMVAIATCYLFVSYALVGTKWFAVDGLLNPTAGRFLLGTEVPGTGAIYRWSPFFAYPGLVLPSALLGVIGSLLMLGSRFSSYGAIASFLLLACFHHRAPLLVTRPEPLIAACLAYFSILPANTEGPRATFVRRLLQIHFVVWIASTLYLMTSFSGWWNGESIRQLILDEQGMLPSSWGTVFFSECLAPGVLAIQSGILVCICNPQIRPWGAWLLGLLVAVILFVMFDVLLALIMVAMATTFWSPVWIHKFLPK